MANMRGGFVVFFFCGIGIVEESTLQLLLSLQMRVERASSIMAIWLFNSFF